jgi:hypothetical protein
MNVGILRTHYRPRHRTKSSASCVRCGVMFSNVSKVIDETIHTPNKTFSNLTHVVRSGSLIMPLELIILITQYVNPNDRTMAYAALHKPSRRRMCVVCEDCHVIMLSDAMNRESPNANCPCCCIQFNMTDTRTVTNVANRYRGNDLRF